MRTRAALVVAVPLLTACAHHEVDATAGVTRPTSASLPAPKASPRKLRDVKVAVGDPTREPRRVVRVRPGDAVSLTLPETAGTVWSVARSAPELGPPAEDVEPSAAGAHQYGVTFTWAPLALPPGTYPVTLAVKGEPDAPVRGVFELTLDVEPGPAQMR